MSILHIGRPMAGHRITQNSAVDFLNEEKSFLPSAGNGGKMKTMETAHPSSERIVARIRNVLSRPACMTNTSTCVRIRV